LFRRHAGLVLRAGGFCVFRVLARHAIVFHQLGIALGFLAVGLHQRLRLFQRGRGFIVGGAVARRVNLIQRLSGFDGIAFGEEPFLDNPAHLRAHFGAHGGGGTAGQLADNGNRLAHQGDNPHFRQGTWGSRCLRIITPGQEE